VRLKLYKGNVIIAGRRSPYSLYDQALASFGDEADYDHADAAGFIRLFALPTRAEATQRLADKVPADGDPHLNGKAPRPDSPSSPSASTETAAAGATTS